MHRMARFLFVCMAGCLFGSQHASGAENGIARRATEVRKEPFRDAARVDTLASGTTVRILQKSGGWYRIKSGKVAGWVRMLSIRRDRARSGGLEPDELMTLATGRAGTGRVVSTTGIRGLGEEELKLARYDEAELVKLDTYAASRAAAKSFAKQGGLTARAVE